jgi:transposase-like protein
MSRSKASTAIKKEEEKDQESYSAEIIPWPDMESILKRKEKAKKKKIHLEEKYLYYKGERIPILQFQKSGYDKLLKLLLKEVER